MPAKELSTLIRLSRANYSLNFPCFANAVTKVWYTFVECRQWRGCENPFLCPAFLFPWFCQSKTQVQSKKALLGFLHSRNVELLRQRNLLPRECLATICKTPSLTVGRRKQLVTVLQYGRLGSGCVVLLNPVGVSFHGAELTFRKLPVTPLKLSLCPQISILQWESGIFPVRVLFSQI